MLIFRPTESRETMTVLLMPTDDDADDVTVYDGFKGVLNDTIAVEYDLKRTDNGEDYDVEWERME